MTYQHIPKFQQKYGVFTPDFTIFIIMKSRDTGNEKSAHFILTGSYYLPWVVINSFDKAMCKGALDHFFSPSKTMEEIARVLKPEGEMIIAIANFESLGFRVGKRLYPVTKFLSPSLYGQRKPWEPPPDHQYKFDYPFLSSLVKQHFEIKKTKGISLLFGLPLWGSLLSRLPHSVSHAILNILDKLARPFPFLADVILMKCTPIYNPK